MTVSPVQQQPRPLLLLVHASKIDEWPTDSDSESNEIVKCKSDQNPIIHS